MYHMGICAEGAGKLLMHVASDSHYLYQLVLDIEREKKEEKTH